MEGAQTIPTQTPAIHDVASAPGGAGAGTRASARPGGLRAKARLAQSVAVLALCAVLAIAAIWLYVSVERSLRELRALGLPALVDARASQVQLVFVQTQQATERRTGETAASKLEARAATLAFATENDAALARVLAAARVTETADAYLFDETGTLFSDVRDTRGLDRVGLLPEGARTVYRLAIRDPGAEIDESATPRPASEWPFTRPVAAALASSAAAGSAPLRGVFLDPYRNYRGAEVIGAWQWLPAQRMGIVAEIGADEAYASLRYVRSALAAALGLFVLSAGWAGWSTLALLRMRGPPATGRRIGAYRLERELAEGGMATVHLARHALLKRPTAIKLLKRHLATDELSARFEREVRLVSELQHPNTVEIYDYGHTPDGLLYYAMEYVDGLTLERLVARAGSLPLDRMRRIVVQVCAALAEVHAKGMVHRDIKPDNVMVCERGGEFDFVKLLDFGIVKRIDVPSDAHPDENRMLTKQVRLLGTPAYMAPERIGEPSAVDARADVYGVGALIFFLVAGRAPFTTSDEAALLRDVLASPAPRLVEVAKGIPVALDELVARCLAKSPAERPGAVRDLINVLAGLNLVPWTREDARGWWEMWRESEGAAKP